MARNSPASLRSTDSKEGKSTFEGFSQFSRIYKWRTIALRIGRRLSENQCETIVGPNRNDVTTRLQSNRIESYFERCVPKEPAFSKHEKTVQERLCEFIFFPKSKTI